MQRVFYPFGTKLGKEIFSLIPNTEAIAYKNEEIDSIRTESGAVLVANTRLIINEQTILKYKNFSTFATVSSGTDHVNWEDLKKHNREFMNSPGCNASSVAEYIWVAIRDQFSGEKFTSSNPQSIRKVGIIGMGNVGTALSKILNRKAIPFLFFDPFVVGSDSLQNVLSCTIVSFHVPLVRKTHHSIQPTEAMVTEKEIDSIPQNGIFLNTSRGGILSDNGLNRLLQRDDLRLVLDVFSPEPVDENLAQKLLLRDNSIYTPHIAGYSQLGRVQGTYQLAVNISRKFKTTYPRSLDSFIQTGLEWKTDTFLEDESNLLKDSWKNKDYGYFESRRNNYPLREDLDS
jgi:erythronate-4-phosphate dehydrogenase